MTLNLSDPWSEPEMVRFLNRQKRLLKTGMNEMNAEKLAELLLYRDRPDSGDDRRLCLECKHWRGKCASFAPGRCPAPTVLQRCDGFVAVVGNQREGVKA